MPINENALEQLAVEKEKTFENFKLDAALEITYIINTYSIKGIYSNLSFQFDTVIYDFQVFLGHFG